MGRPNGLRLNFLDIRFRFGTWRNLRYNIITYAVNFDINLISLLPLSGGFLSLTPKVMIELWFKTEFLKSA